MAEREKPSAAALTAAEKVVGEVLGSWAVEVEQGKKPDVIRDVARAFESQYLASVTFAQTLELALEIAQLRRMASASVEHPTGGGKDAPREYSIVITHLEDAAMRYTRGLVLETGGVISLTDLERKRP